MISPASNMKLPRPRTPRARRLAAAVAFFALALVLPAAAGAAPSSSGGATFFTPPVTAPGGAFAGKKARLSGHVDSGPGTVAISARIGQADFLPIGTARADSDGDFTFRWTPPKSGRYDFRLTLVGPASAAADAPVGSVSVYRRQKATWYGPGFYGQRTACGIKLTRRTLGVAHKRLPCGTKVEFFLRGKRIVLPVIDRGPFANHAVWDLTLASMRRLGSGSTEFVGALPQQ